MLRLSWLHTDPGLVFFYHTKKIVKLVLFPAIIIFVFLHKVNEYFKTHFSNSINCTPSYLGKHLLKVPVEDISLIFAASIQMKFAFELYLYLVPNFVQRLIGIAPLNRSAQLIWTMLCLHLRL